MARLAAAFYGHPARDLLMVGVTGTNGKTTVTQLLGDLLTATGRPTNVMGTLSGARTTPEATEVQRVLAGVRDRQKSDGARHAVAMEVSSHALVQSRVEGIHFDVAVFTNLSHDHLDYHGTMEEYFEAKAMLFTPGYALRGVVNADDPWGRRLLERARIPMVAVQPRDATDIVLQPGRTEFTWRGQRVTTPLTGAINVDNTLLAAEAALALDELALAPAEIAQAMGSLSPVPGRLQVIAVPAPEAIPQSPAQERRVAQRGEGERPPFTVLVDYAHTPAGLEVVLGEARTLVAGRPGAVRLRLRRQPGPGQAAAHGRRRRAPERPGVPDVGQPARRGPAGDHRRGAGRRTPAGGTTRGSWSSPTAGWPSAVPSTRRARATSSSSPGRATRPIRRSRESGCPSTTRSRRATRCRCASVRTRHMGAGRAATAPAAVTGAPKASVRAARRGSHPEA